MIRSAPLSLGALCVATVLLLGSGASDRDDAPREAVVPKSHAQAGGDAAEKAAAIEYLEIVTASVNETCAVLAKAHGVAFGEPVATLGFARTAPMSGGGRIGVRAPMHGAEEPVVRPYILVEDLKAAVEAAVEAGAEIAIPSMEIPGEGTIAIYVLGGIEHALWQR